MKKGLKISTATLLAVSALTPVAAFAAESTVADGIYTNHGAGYYTAAQFSKLSATDKKAIFADSKAALVAGGTAYNLLKDVALKSDAQIDAVTTTVEQYEAAQGVKLDSGKGFGEVVVTELKVESVKAINNKEILVTFNKELDKDSAETVANYTLSNAALGAVTPKLSADKKSVTLTVATPAAQQAKSDVTIKNVKDSAGTIVAETKKSVTFLDLTLPTADSVAVTGPKTLEVVFSEPLQSVPNFVLNGGSYSVTPTGFVAGDKKVTLTLGATLPTGTHKVEVSGGADYSAVPGGFAVAKTELSFNYQADTTVPTATVEKATEKVVTLKFDKPVKVNVVNDVTAFHSINNQATYQGTVAAVPASVVNGYADKFTVTFGTPIPAGAGKTLFLNTKANAFEDQWGNDVASATYAFDLVSDVTAPTVTKVEATGKNTTAQKELTVTFDEDVVLADAQNKANYILKDANGNVVKTADFADVDNTGKFNTNAGIVYNPTKKTATITTTAALKAGAYQLTVENVKDTSFNNNKLVSQTTSFIVTDLIPPTVTTANLVGTDVIYVDFSEAMNTAGMTDISKYALSTDGAFPANTTVEVVNNKRVKITLPNGHGLIGAQKVQVDGNFKDIAGNALGGFYKESTAFTFGTATPFTITKVADQVKLVAANQLQFEVDTELSAIDVNKFTFNDGTGTANALVTVSSATYVNNNGKATVTVTLSDDLAATDVTAVNIQDLDIAVGGLTNSLGTATNAITTFTTAGGHFEDKVAAKVVSSETTTTSTITLTFSEALNVGDISNLTFKVAGNTVAGVNTGTPKKVIITLVDPIDADATPAITQTLDIRDTAGNVLPAATAVTATKDKIAVAATATVSTQDSVAAGASTVITFSEPLDIASKAAVEAAVIGGTTGVTAATDLGFSWSGNKVTVTNNHASTAALFAADVTVANVKDVAGNNTASVSIDLKL